MTGTTVSKWLPAGLAPLELSLLSMLSSPVRIEEHTDDKHYTLRAEVPGVDPAKDVTVTYHDGVLRLQIRRTDVRKDKTHTEFSYGTYDRTVPMSTGIEEDSIRASYQDGILEISAKVSADGESHRAIPITVGAGVPTGKSAKH